RRMGQAVGTGSVGGWVGDAWAAAALGAPGAAAALVPGVLAGPAFGLRSGHVTGSLAGLLAGLATSVSGQRARGATSSESVKPSASRSTPAQAIIAPLSVHSSAGGTTRTVPASNAMPFMTLRI